MRSDKIQTIDPAKAYLGRYRALMIRHQELTENIRLLEERATNTAAKIKSVNVQRGGPSDLVGETAASVADMEAMLSETARSVQEQMREIISTIEQVPGAMEQAILTKRYIGRKSWTVICHEVDLEKSRVFELHRWGIAAVRRILAERDD